MSLLSEYLKKGVKVTVSFAFGKGKKEKLTLKEKILGKQREDNTKEQLAKIQS